MSENKYPADWDQRRRHVYDRDEYTCQNCGAQGSPYGDAELHAHHIVDVVSGGTHDPSNLVTLCSDCHTATHTASITAPTAERTPSSTRAPRRQARRMQVPLGARETDAGGSMSCC